MAKIQFCLSGKTLVELCREFPEVVAEAIERNNMETAPSTDVQQLKAEIAAILPKLVDSYIDRKHDVFTFNIGELSRRLSAV
jgi:hypothetical protein